MSRLLLSLSVAVGVLCLSNGFTIYKWSTTNSALVQEKANHKADVELFKQTQAEANKKAEALKEKLLKESKLEAKKADEQYSDLLKQYRANLVRYKANQSSSVGPSGGELQPAQSGDRPSPSTDVLISLADANVCAVNTARLQAVRDWAIGLPH